MGLYSGGLVFGRNSLLELSGGGVFSGQSVFGKGVGGGGGSLWYLGNQFSQQNKLWT